MLYIVPFPVETSGIPFSQIMNSLVALSIAIEGFYAAVSYSAEMQVQFCTGVVNSLVSETAWKIAKRCSCEKRLLAFHNGDGDIVGIGVELLRYAGKRKPYFIALRLQYIFYPYGNYAIA